MLRMPIRVSTAIYIQCDERERKKLRRRWAQKSAQQIRKARGRMGGKSEPRFLQRLHTLGRTSLDSNAILASEPWLVASKKLWRRLCKVALRLGLGPNQLGSTRKDRPALSPYQAWRCRGARMRE